MSKVVGKVGCNVFNMRRCWFYDCIYITEVIIL